MNLEILPMRTAGAAENMAIDFLLLQRYPQAGVPRFRHYEWRGPAFTFGYAQKIGFVREQLSTSARTAADMPSGEPFDLCRRPTGGGIVDHRADWTYALVIPRGHPLEELPATQSYRVIHEALAAALRAQAVDAITKETSAADDMVASSLPAAAVTKEGVCFERAEKYDVVHARTGEKIAGAAQKRNKQGLLFQGSIWRPVAVRPDAAVDWERFEETFVAGLASALNGRAQHVPWPEFNEDELSGLTEQYSSLEWIAFR